LDFLLQTSILDRLCGPLCDALTGDTGGGAILENLDHANLFIIPLDDEGVWYRYHHLFADVLRARLRQNHPELPAELHRRASIWYEAHASIAEAVKHALAAGDVLRAADLIDRERWTLLGRGEANTLRGWLDELPPEIVNDHPGLNLAYAWIFSLLEQAEAIEPRLQDAEKALALTASRNSGQPARLGDAIRGEIATLRAETALSQSDIPRAIDLCRNALKLLPEENALMRGVTTYFLGHGERRSGHMAEAERAYTKASSLGLQVDNLLLALHALANLSTVQITMGRLSDAAETSQRILQIAADRRRQAWPVAGLAYQGLSRLHYEWNDLDAAERYARLGIEYGQRGGLTGLEINSQSVLAFTLQAQHDQGGADQVMGHIVAMTEERHHPVHTAQAAAWAARLRLRQGLTDQAIRWAEARNLPIEDPALPYTREVEYLTLVRVLIVQKHFSAALELLGRLLQAASTDQRTGSLIQILMLQALAFKNQGNHSEAMDAFEHALTLAAPEGYLRTFLDEAEPMRLLLVDLQSWIRQKNGAVLDDASLRLLAYAYRLLAAFSQPAPLASQAPVTLLEPLSERELEVLRLISEGLTNQEIAAILVVATSTVKSHINHLYGKLGTTRRTQAIAIARDLGLLSE
jgi:LuxR family maltose regulon positive regulatory protein